MPPKHSFVSAVVDSGDPDLVGPDEWNDPHVETVNEEASSGTALGVNVSDDSAHMVTLDDDCTITLSGFVADTFHSAVLGLVQDGSGGHSWTLSGVVWVSGSAPTPSSAPGAIDWVTVWSVDGGTTVYATAGQPATSGGVPSGTSFPGSPTTGDLFYRTDRHLEYFYDGTRWLTTQLFREQGARPRGTQPLPLATITAHAWTPHSQYSMYLERMDVTTFVNTTNSGSAYWVSQLRSANAANTKTNIGSAASTQSDSPNTWNRDVITLNAVVDTSTEIDIELTLTPTGSPGSIYIGVGITYRLIG